MLRALPMGKLRCAWIPHHQPGRSARAGWGGARSPAGEPTPNGNGHVLPAYVQARGPVAIATTALEQALCNNLLGREWHLQIEKVFLLHQIMAKQDGQQGARNTQNKYQETQVGAGIRQADVNQDMLDD